LQCVELSLCFVYALLKDFDASLVSDAYIAIIEIYAARRFP